MQRRTIVTTSAVAIAATVTLGLTGCTDPDNGSKPGEVTVVGNGEVRGAPDILNATIGTEVTAPDVEAAVSQSNERAQAMIDAVKAAGVSSDDVRTENVSIQPEYGSPGPDGGASTITGYRASNSVKIVVRDLSKASDVLDKAVQAGGNSARLGGVSFAIDDNSALLSQARERAFNDAKARAEQYADLSDLSLGSVITISESSSGTAPQPELRADSQASYALEPGQQTVGFQVTVKWALD